MSLPSIVHLNDTAPFSIKTPFPFLRLCAPMVKVKSPLAGSYVAFDGVNTTFKITHGGGSSADIVNSAQLQIAINNVIQKANLDSSYTEGFLVVDSRKIQFKTAPTADDIFWGNITLYPWNS